MSETTARNPLLHGWRQLLVILEMIKFEHTIFALPFALMGAVMAARGWPEGGTLFWIILAMAGARSSAMAFNRLVDREIDRRNPRTASRALPVGILTTVQVWIFVGATTAVFFVAAWQLNTLALALSPLALAIIWGYSYTKRFTDYSHLFLGLAIGIAPSAAWVAVTGALDLAPLALTVAVMFWVAGFDVIYSLQDIDFDRKSGLHSLPARLGVRGALWVSASMHAATILCLLLTRAWYPVGGWYFAGVAGVALLLAYEHSLVTPEDLSKVNAAFFTVNGFISMGLLGCVVADVLG